MALRHTPLVPPDSVTSSQSYRQLSRCPEDENFRTALEDLIEHETFASLCRTLSAEGAVSLTGLLPSARFNEFRQTYDAEMREKGSRGSLHSYLNVASSAPLLASSGLWETVAHPLFVVLIAYALGGPIKIVDLRAKDTYPVDVVARDNTLHLDNSPFMDEYKVVVTWTLGTSQGPSGQGLTYLPRTNRLFRECFAEPDGTVWSDEDACIFPSGARVDEVLSAQARFLDGAGPQVVHLTDLEAPCQTIFVASRLVHHRYRTSAGAARSAVMTSFHRTDDSAEFLESGESRHSPLQRFLGTGGSRQRFLAAVGREMPVIADALDRIAARPSLVVDPRRHMLTGRSFDKWYSRQCEGVTLNNLRSRNMAGMAGDAARDASPVEWLVQRLRYDVQGPLNMPFFADMRETRRKRARIWLREMSPERISEVVENVYARSPHAATPAAAKAPVADLRTCLRDLDRTLSESPGTASGDGTLDPTAEGAARSLPRFIGDLRITVSWLDDTDTDSVVTAAAFAFLAAALSSSWFTLGDAGRDVTERLLQRYLSLVGDAPGVRA